VVIFAGTEKIDITPHGSIWMDGMLRAHPSEGVHDALYARTLVLCEGSDVKQAFALVSVDVCVLDEATCRAVRQGAESQTGIPASHMIIAATHTHSGPSTMGILTPREDGYVQVLTSQLIALIEDATRNLRPAELGVASGSEDTISHYRRLLADDGHVVMNWEPYPPEQIVGPLGVADPEVGVVKLVRAGDPGDPAKPGRVLALLFNHTGHPNVLSGDNYLFSADYPGFAAQLLEEEFGGAALFFNGALGSVDIDGLRDRDWEGLDRTGRALARSVSEAAHTITPSGSPVIRGASTTYTLPGRRITDAEWRWAQGVLAETGGQVAAVADGVGDDYKAAFYRDLHDAGPRDLPMEQICLALDDSALLTFPGELYTEIGQYIKAHSPFRRTFIIGLANGYAGYVPTRKAIGEGGYAEDTRHVDETAEQLVIEHSLALLHQLHGTSNG
jgi:neutral ceramidase